MCVSEGGANPQEKNALRCPGCPRLQRKKADKAVQIQKLKIQQKDCKQVFCEEVALDNVFKFPYLGSRFTADGDVMHDVEARIAMALKRWGDLRQIFTSDDLSLGTKIRDPFVFCSSVLTPILWV